MFKIDQENIKLSQRKKKKNHEAWISETQFIIMHNSARVLILWRTCWLFENNAQHKMNLWEIEFM